MSRDLAEVDKRKRNNLLTQYYGISEEKDVENPFDVDGKHFHADAFVDKLVKVRFQCIFLNHHSLIINLHQRTQASSS